MESNADHTFDRVKLGIRCSGLGFWAVGPSPKKAFKRWKALVDREQEKLVVEPNENENNQLAK